MSKPALSRIQQKVWDGRLPVEIRLAPSECRTYDQSDPFLISLPRLSYLPLLLPRLLDFFRPFLIADVVEVASWDGYLTYDGVPLKWHLPVGLLYDIYALSSQTPESQLPLPFRLTLHFSNASSMAPNAKVNLIKPEPIVLHDSFINSVKEADFLRSGTAKPIMSLSAADSKALWSSTQTNDLQTHSRVYNSLLPNQFRNIPMRVYLPLVTQPGPKHGSDQGPSIACATIHCTRVSESRNSPSAHTRSATDSRNSTSRNATESLP